MKNVKNTTGGIMSRECKLKPGDDTAEFIIKFNDMNFDVMAGLDLDHKTGIYGMVFFERTEKIVCKKKRFTTRLINWFQGLFKG